MGGEPIRIYPLRSTPARPYALLSGHEQAMKLVPSNPRRARVSNGLLRQSPDSDDHLLAVELRCGPGGSSQAELKHRKRKKSDVYPLMITLVYRSDFQSDVPSLGPGSSETPRPDRME